jgi:hypothetical protein
MTKNNQEEIKKINNHIIELVNKFFDLNYKKKEFIQGVSEIPT